MTLLQIIKKIEFLISTHKGMGDFVFGPITSESKILNKKYPLMLMDILSSEITQHADTYTFIVLILEPNSNSQNSDLDILNDTALIINDLINLIYNDDQLQLFLTNVMTKNSFKHKFDSDASGWQIELKITIPRFQNKCLIP